MKIFIKSSPRYRVRCVGAFEGDERLLHKSNDESGFDTDPLKGKQNIHAQGCWFDWLNKVFAPTKSVEQALIEARLG